MPTKPNRKHPKPRHAKRASNGPKRSPNGRFKGQPRTLSETSMPDEYAPGAEAPREGAEKAVPVVKPLSVFPPGYASGSGGCAMEGPGGAGGVGQITHTPKRAVKAECPGGYFYTVTYVGKPRPWYRRLWAAVREWMR